MITKLPVRDMQANIVKVGDDILYVTGGGSSTYFNYGTVIGVEQREWYGRKTYRLHVLKKGGPYFKKQRNVILENPKMFKCGVVLEMVTDTVIQGQ